MPTVIDTAPAVEPLGTSEAKLHMRIDHSDEDALVDALVTAARRHIEGVVLNRALITQTWNLYLDYWPGNEIRLPYPPLQSVTGVYYTPEDDSEQTFATANYVVDTYSEPGRVRLKDTKSWPTDELVVINGIRVEFVAGYGDAASDVPRDIRQAMLMLVGDLYENREETIVVQGLQVQRIPFGVAALLGSHRIPPELSHS